MRVEFIPREIAIAARPAINAFVQVMPSPIQLEMRFAFKNLDLRCVRRPGQGTSLFLSILGANMQTERVELQVSFFVSCGENACAVDAHTQPRDVD